MVMSRGRRASAPPACFPAPSPKQQLCLHRCWPRAHRFALREALLQAVPDAVSPVRVVGLAL